MKTPNNLIYFKIKKNLPFKKSDLIGFYSLSITFYVIKTNNSGVNKSKYYFNINL